MSRVEAASWVGERRWDLTLKGGITVELPQGDPTPALRRLAMAQEKDAILDKTISSIDLRQPDRMMIRASATADAQEYKAAESRSSI